MPNIATKHMGNPSLDVLAGDTRINKRVRTTASKGTYLTLNTDDTLWTPSNLPATLWVEGYQTSGSGGDITLRLAYFLTLNPPEMVHWDEH